MAQPSPPGLPARRAALAMLDAVINRGEPLDRVAPGACRGLPPADRALALAIAGEVLRWLGPLDALIDGATERPLPPDAKARMVLRMALAQRLRLGTPGHAAIGTALPLLAGGPKRLAHGVFGTIDRAGVTLPPGAPLPAPVATRWQAAWGPETVAAASAAWSAPPPLDLRLARPDDTGAWAARLGGTSLMPGHVRLPRGQDVGTLDGFSAGAWWVQDVSAQLPALLLGAGDGRRVADLCAAPGGKAMQLAAAGWQVTALDRSKRRLERLAANAARTGLPIDARTGDALRWRGDAPFDAVLLDAPCSATGIFRRHPDVLHRVRDADIDALGAAQSAMLDHAATLLRPGGSLVYATCSLEPAEGEAQLARFLGAHGGWRVAPPDPAMLPAGLAAQADGSVRIVPPALAEAGGADGFFIARLVAPRG